MVPKRYSKILFIFFMGLGMSLLMTLIITYINTGYDELYIEIFESLVGKFTSCNDRNNFSCPNC